MGVMRADESRNNDHVVAVVLAGGVGVRAGLGMPKQLAQISGKTIIEHTIAALNSSPDIDEIIVMMEPAHLDAIAALQQAGTYAKVTAVYPGGVTRNDTTRIALSKLGSADIKVLFHDAVRPFVDHRILHDCVSALDHYDAVDTAIPSADTIIEVTGSPEVISAVPPRAALRRGQTPQAFRLSAIREAYALAEQDENFAATDDCSVVLRYTPSVPIAVVAGSDENMKITEAIDVFIADKLFQLRSAGVDERSASEREQALRGKTLVVFGGSDGIGQSICVLARQYGAAVFSFSRSSTGTHIENREQIAEALAKASAETGRVDFVVNTAGTLEIGSLESFSPEAVRSSIDINLLGPIHLAQEALPYLKQTRGQLVFFTSSSYTRGRANYGIYSATKAATVNLTQALAEEWADNGVRVNCINPRRTKTAMRLQAFGEEPEGSLLEADRVAEVSIDMLVSDVTGQIVDVKR